MKSLRSSLCPLLALSLWVCASPVLAQTLPILTVRSFSWTEGDQGSTRMPVTFSVPSFATAPVSGLVNVRVLSSSGSRSASATPGATCGPGVDFVEIVNRRFEIPVGSTSTTIEVEICGDRVFEQDEHFSIGVSAADLVGARCLNNAPACGSVPTIVNDDSNNGGPVVRIDDIRVQEPLSDTASAVVTVSLARTSSSNVTVGYRTQSDTASSQFSPFIISGLTPCVGRDFRTGATVTRDFLPAGGTVVIPAGRPSAQIVVGICADGRTSAEPDKRFFVVLTSASSNSGGLADGRGEVTILANGPPAAGTFQISPDRASVPAGEQQLYQVIWTVPEGKVWRDLSTIALRIRDDEHTALWVLWNELDDTFRLCRQARGHGPHGANNNDDDDDEAAHLSGIPHNGCSPGALAGSPTVLETKAARLHMATTRAVGSGPAGRTVTLSLGISFKPRAVGPQRIELTASDDFGAADPWTRATSVRVLRRDGTL